MISNIKVVKMLGWLNVLGNIVCDLRKAEIRTSERFRHLRIWQILLGKPWYTYITVFSQADNMFRKRADYACPPCDLWRICHHCGCQRGRESVISAGVHLAFSHHPSHKSPDHLLPSLAILYSGCGMLFAHRIILLPAGVVSRLGTLRGSH